MTVEEAKQKVCPFTVQYGGAPSSKDVGGFGLHTGDMQASNCICGNCMAWVKAPLEYSKCYGLIIGGVCNSCSKKYSIERGYGSHMEGMVCDNEVPTYESQNSGYCVRIGQ